MGIHAIVVCRADVALTILRLWTIIKTQGDACANKHLPVAKPRRLPQHTSYELERLALKNREPFWCQQTAHFFFRCLSRASYQADKARETQCCKRNRWLREQPKMSKLYVSPPRNRFPVKAAYTPPFRFHGMAGNRLLPYTVCKGEKTQRGRWNFTKPIIQIIMGKSKKIDALRRMRRDL